jgi:uncharacterized protein (TIGR03066 family)
MKTINSGLIVLALVGLISSLAHADEKIDKAKLTAKWKLVKSSEKSAPIGATVEFTKDGKLILTVEQNGNTDKIEGTYTLEGDKINAMLKKGDQQKEDVLKIKSLSGDKFSFEDDKGHLHEFEKVK